jgi:monothiol glutaredoxin
LTQHRIVLFMKGTAEQPMCGFSAKVVKILAMNNAQNVKYIDVLADAQLRNNIKLFTDWPTIPQLYIAREFIGGCDIITQLHETGELSKLLIS